MPKQNQPELFSEYECDELLDNQSKSNNAIKETILDTQGNLEVFIPIKKDNIAHYYSAGMILPKSYLNSNAINDVQNLCDGYILASKEKQLKSLKKMDIDFTSDCLICVSIDTRWIHKEGETSFIIKYPIPLSRIKTIYIKNFIDIENIIINMNMQTSVGGVAFIDKEIFQEYGNIKEKHMSMDTFPNFDSAENLADKINKFDRLLGAMAFVQYSNNGMYNKCFFDELSSLNKAVKDEFEKSTKKQANITIKRLSHQNLNYYGTQDYRAEISKIENKSIKPDDNGQFLVYKNNFSINDKVTEGLKILYTLSLNGEHIENDCEFLNNDILFLYGYSKGYNNLRSLYGKKKVKFDLKSYIDRIAIEIIYQYVFFDNTDIVLDVFEEYKKPVEQIRKERSKNEDKYSKYDVYYLFDSVTPMSIIEFLLELEYYKDDKKLLKEASNIIKTLINENSITSDLKNIGSNIERSLPAFMENLGNISSKLNEMLIDKAQEFKEIQMKFLLRMEELAGLRKKNDELIEENEILKAKIKKLEAKG